MDLQSKDALISSQKEQISHLEVKLESHVQSLNNQNNELLIKTEETMTRLEESETRNKALEAEIQTLKKSVLSQKVKALCSRSESVLLAKAFS